MLKILDRLMQVPDHLALVDGASVQHPAHVSHRLDLADHLVRRPVDVVLRVLAELSQPILDVVMERVGLRGEQLLQGRRVLVARVRWSRGVSSMASHASKVSRVIDGDLRVKLVDKGLLLGQAILCTRRTRGHESWPGGNRLAGLFLHLLIGGDDQRVLPLVCRRLLLLHGGRLWCARGHALVVVDRGRVLPGDVCGWHDGFDCLGRSDWPLFCLQAADPLARRDHLRMAGVVQFARMGRGRRAIKQQGSQVLVGVFLPQREALVALVVHQSVPELLGLRLHRGWRQSGGRRIQTALRSPVLAQRLLKARRCRRRRQRLPRAAVSLLRHVQSLLVEGRRSLLHRRHGRQQPRRPGPSVRNPAAAGLSHRRDSRGRGRVVPTELARQVFQTELRPDGCDLGLLSLRVRRAVPRPCPGSQIPRALLRQP